tara:strand:+ start:355 stop:819 length:465 start_codon:yes stop_codon:yes gene_type:complete
VAAWAKEGAGENALRPQDHLDELTAFVERISENPEMLRSLPSHEFPFVLALAFAMVVTVLMRWSPIPNPYFAFIVGFSWGPVVIQLLTMVIGLSPWAEPAFFHSSWWLVSLGLGGISPWLYRWSRTGSPTVVVGFIVGIVIIFGLLASLADSLT